jgi:DNA-binding NarL/FixJ family response regulator
MWTSAGMCRTLCAEIGLGASGLALVVEAERVTCRTRTRIEPPLADLYERLLLRNLPERSGAVAIGRLRSLPGERTARTRLADGVYVYARREQRVACSIVGLVDGALPRHRRTRLEHAAARLARAYVAEDNTLRASAERALAESATSGVDVLRALLTGRLLPLDQFDSDGRRVIVARVRQEPRDELTTRELEICECVARGHSNKRIAIDLGITETTVTTHLARALAKAGLRCRMDLIQLLASVAL